MMVYVQILYIFIIWGRKKFISQNGIANEKSLRNAALVLILLFFLVSEASWASSLSPDEEGPLSPGNDSEAAAAKFVRLFVTDLFNDASTLNLERKAHFGELIRLVL